MEFLHHVGAGADHAVFVVVAGALIVHDGHGGVRQVAGQVDIGGNGLDGDGIVGVVSGDDGLELQEVLGGGGAFGALLADIVQGVLDLAGGHVHAVGELDAALELDGPGQVVVGAGDALGQAGDGLAVVVELKKALADAVAHAVPGAVGLHPGGDHAVGIHLAAEGEGLFRSRSGLVAAAGRAGVGGRFAAAGFAAAARDQSGQHQDAEDECEDSFHFSSFLFIVSIWNFTNALSYSVSVSVRP